MIAITKAFPMDGDARQARQHAMVAAFMAIDGWAAG